MPQITAPSRPPHYPDHLERHLRLEDGSRVFVRPLVPEDAPILAAAAGTADAETLYHRFFTPAPPLDAGNIAYLTHLDYDRRMALAAFDEDGAGIAVVRYEGNRDSDEAEVAFVVDRPYRRHGLASALYGLLEAAAVDNGITRFTALYLPENAAVATLLDRLGFSEPIVIDGVAEVSKDLRAG